MTRFSKLKLHMLLDEWSRLPWRDSTKT